MASSPVPPTEDEQVPLAIHDLHISLQAEQEDTQKKTFTCWINSQLAKHTPPSAVSDLFTDIKKGHILLDLLEVLSGQQLPRDKGLNTFQCRINIEHALTFLKNRSIKLINIHVADIVDGNPSIILGLIWTIILHFHIEELARTLSCDYNPPPADDVNVPDASPTSSPPAKKCSKAQERWQMSAKKALLLWAQEQCATYEAVSVTDFKSSWRNGLAFLAIIHALRPDLVDMTSVKHRSNKDNLTEAFRIAEQELKIPRLLEPEDVDVVNPDEKSIMTYVAQFLRYSKDAPVARHESQGGVKDAADWLRQQRNKLQKALEESENEPYFNKYHNFLSFMESFNGEKTSFLDLLPVKRHPGELNEEELQLRGDWDSLNQQISLWKTELNRALPSPLHQTEAWLQALEELVDGDLPASQDCVEAMALTQEKMTLFKSLMDEWDHNLNTLTAFENRDEKHLPLVPPDKLEEMKRRINNIAGRNFAALLEFHYHRCSVLGLLHEVRSRLEVWNARYGNKASVEVLQEDWHKFIEEKGLLVQIDTSFQKCEEIYKDLAGECQYINEQYKTMENNVCMYKKHIYNVKSTLQKVLACWATYMEKLRSLKACFEETKKEQIKEVPFEVLSQWNVEHITLNEVGNFLIGVSTDEVGSSISKELRRLNKRWRKFITKTQLEMKLPLVKKQDQPILDNSGNILLPKEEKPTVDVLADMSSEVPEDHREDLKAGEEHEEKEEFMGQLNVTREVENLTRQVDIWEAETKSVLDLLRQQDDVGMPMEESLQHLIAKGSMYEELVARTEDTLQIDVQNISSQESLQHVLTTGLQTKIQEAKEKIQINVVKLIAASKNSSDISPGLDVRLQVQESQKELESQITKAEQLLEQRESPTALISKYKDALMLLNSKSMAKYLKALEEMKHSVTEDAQLSLGEKSRDVCAKWEINLESAAVTLDELLTAEASLMKREGHCLLGSVIARSLHHELSLYMQQLKVDIEKEKLSDCISKLEKQINREKKLLRRGRTKGLLQEHEACFSKEGILQQLHQHRDVLRELCEELTLQESQQEVKRTLRDYEQKIDRLLRCASEIHMTLRDPSGNKESVATTENGGRDSHSEVPFAKSDNEPSNEKAIEPVNVILASEMKPQQGESIMEKHDKDIQSLQNRCIAQKEILESHLQSNKFRILSEFSSENEGTTACLQDKLRDLQGLKNETDDHWKEFEITSFKLENRVSDAEKPLIVKARDELQEQERELQMALHARLASLETALRLVSPIEKESVSLCGLDLSLHELVIQESCVLNADGIHQNLRDIQDSIAKQIELCNEELDTFASKELHPSDLHATQNIVLSCRTQLEEMSHKVQVREEALRAVEDFLASLRAAGLSAEGVADWLALNLQEAPGNTSLGKNEGRAMDPLKDKAKHLDERLETLGIRFKDIEQGENTSCEKLVDALSIKVLERHGCSLREELTEEAELLMACASKNNELFKNIQEVQNQISKVGLKDPTVPAVKHRKKSLIKLDKDLDGYEDEKRRLEEMSHSLPRFQDGRDIALSQQCQSTVLLWENTKASITESLDQCGRVLELLKQYHNFKSILTALIQKEENAISLQASYMGKENLKKRIAEIETIKEEFNEHVEVVDKINQICKNLQFHLNKMKTFEEPPFEKEANIIVDRWLDINEKTEDHYENLGRALALWDKLYNLKNVVDEWTEEVLQKMELQQLTEEARERLKEELQVHEQKSWEFSRRVAEIQSLLQSSEKPLELQVMESSVLKQMEHAKRCLTGDPGCPVLGDSPAELREDLHQAKTRIGMTESLLNALSPSDSLEIFSKLEEIQQQILQQKHSMTVLGNQIGRMTPELSELKKQYESVSDLFNTKKSLLQDHFSKLLNDQCQNFNDWFSNVKMNLKECFESSETREKVEQKLLKLSDFLTLEGRSSKIQQVQTVLEHVKKHLPKAHVTELNSWLLSQELELEQMESVCQARAKQLEDSLQQLLRLQDEHRNLSKWLTHQEDKWKEMEDSEEKTELICQALARKREQFESMAQLNSSLKEFGLTEEEAIIMESTRLLDRYQGLLRQVRDIEEEDKLPRTEDLSFNDLARDVIHWIKEIKESLMALNSSEGKMPLEERIQKIKEIILLKPEGDAKIQSILREAESSEAPSVQETLTDIKSRWDNTLCLANTYLSHQEMLLLEGEKYLKSKEDLRLMLTDLKKNQEAGFALQHGLQEKNAQLNIYKKFLKKAQDLTSLLKELESQGNYLLECTNNPSFSKEPWLEIKLLHRSLLQQLQDSVQKLEGHVQEHHSYQVCITDMNATLDSLCKEFSSFAEKPEAQIAAEEKLQKLEELENQLRLQDDTLDKISALAKSVKQNTSSVGQKMIQDDVEALQRKQKDLGSRIESAKEETESCLNNMLRWKHSTEEEEKFPLPGGEQVTCEVLEAAPEEKEGEEEEEEEEEAAAVEKWEEDQEMNQNSAVETILSKQLSVDVQGSMKNNEDEQKVNELRDQPLELDMMLRNEQLKEIEELLTQLEAKKAALEALEPSTHLNQAENSVMSLRDTRYPAQHLDRLLQALVTLKEDKESQYCLLRDFQEQLTAAQCSRKAMLTEKESVKGGSLDAATYLDKMKELLASIEREKGFLSKLKIEWEDVSKLLTDMDKKLLESQMQQLARGWERAEQLVQRKQSQQAVQSAEFTSIMSQVRDLERSLQRQQQCLQSWLRSSDSQEGSPSVVALATELHTTKHQFSVLKGLAELQMKRIWGEKENMILEEAINNLKNQWEALAPLNLEVENQIKKCDIRSEVKEATQWIGNLLGELTSPVSLLPEDIVSQIRKCKVTHDNILDKQQTLESLVGKIKDGISNLPSDESNDLNELLVDLQNQYQALVLKSTRRSQQLERQLEDRSKLFGMIGQVYCTLQKNELLMMDRAGMTSTGAELEQHLVTLRGSQEELQKAANLISTLLQELSDISEGLSVFERLFLDDQLKNLQTRVGQTQRFVENTCREVEHKLNFVRAFQEKVSVLQKEVDSIQHSKLLLNQATDQDTKKELHGLKDRLMSVQRCILQVLKLKEVFDCMGLTWDHPQLDQLQVQILEKETRLEEQIKQLDVLVAERNRCQEALSKMKSVDWHIKKRAEALGNAADTSPETCLLDAQILNQRIEKAKCFHDEMIRKLSESEAFEDAFKEKEIEQIMQNAKDNEKLHRLLQNTILESQPKEIDEKTLQDTLENSLRTLNQIKSQLQQPLVIDPDITHIQNEKDNCEAWQERVQAGVHILKAVVVPEKAEGERPHAMSDVDTKLADIEDLQTQLSASIDLRTNLLNEAYENVICYNEAVTRAAGLIASLGTIQASQTADLDNPEESLAMLRHKQEELEYTLADIQGLAARLGAVCSPQANLQVQGTLQDLVSKKSALQEAAREAEAKLERYLQNYKNYGKIKEKICAHLGKMRTVLGQSIFPLPVSYKAALERLEQSKVLLTSVESVKEDLVKLRQVIRHLSPRCTGRVGVLAQWALSALWEEWLRLLEAARAWETWSESLKQSWKFVSQEIEREAIILDNLQEELPEVSRTREAASQEELSELSESLCRYKQQVEKQQLLLSLLLERLKGVQTVPESPRALGTFPALQEITAMQERCNTLFQKAQKSQELVQTEIQDRHSFTKEIIALKRLFQQTAASFQNLSAQEHPEEAGRLEELQSILKEGRQTLERLMEKLRIKYSEMYTIVPAEMSSQVEECQKALEDLDEKISNEVRKSSPSYAMHRKIEEINSGLQHVEKMLQQKSKDIEEAQEIQKKMWDELDLWHARLNELDAEVQDIVEQDPGQAQEWMDHLMTPLQLYQQVSQGAEWRTSQLNKATVKMEEYSELVKSTEAWIGNISRLLANPANYDSARTLSHHASTLQMALEDSEQKLNLLHSIFTDLEDFSAIFDTDELTQSIQELSGQVTALQQKLMESLPQIQRMADDVVAIESEVKSMEKKVSKIKTILLSKEIFDFSPEEHLKHGEVILENLRPMKKTIAEIMSYQVELRLPQAEMKPLPVFLRTSQLLQDVKLLENMTQEQNELLKVVINQTNEYDEEIKNFKEILNNYSDDVSPEHQAGNLPQIQGEIEQVEMQILSLNQKKEELLVDLKAAVLNLQEHLKQEQEEVGGELLPARVSEEGGMAERDAPDWQLNRRGSMSFLPVVKEEAEEGSVKSEDGDKKTEPSSASWSSVWKHDSDEEEDRASSSSATLIQEADGKISTCDSSMVQSLAPASPNTEQGTEFSQGPAKQKRFKSLAMRTLISGPACLFPHLSEKTRKFNDAGATPPIEALDFPDEPGAAGATVGKGGPEPAQLLHACKSRVAELELWLQQASVAFEPETLNADMQQVVEQQLVGCQAMLIDIEHKVASLLETCKEQGLGESGAIQYEAEALSLKLSTVRCDLEKVQAVLQQRCSEDQKPPEHQNALQPGDLSELEPLVIERPQFSRQKDVQPQQVLELKPLDQKNLIKFIEVNAKKMGPQCCQRDKDIASQESSESSNRDSHPESGVPNMSPEGQVGDKWLYLHRELSAQSRPPLPQLVEPQVAATMNILPSVSVYNFRYPTAEELETYTTQLEDLHQEASHLQTQEHMTDDNYINLEKKLFDLFLALSQCLGSVEELLHTPGLFREDLAAQQAHHEALALELKKLHLALNGKKDNLVKAMTFPGRSPSLLPECFQHLQARLELMQVTASSKSQSLKAGLDYNRSYQNEIKRLYDQLIQKKAALQQSLNEIGGQHVGEQLQKADAHMAELQNSESQVAKLRNQGERLHLPYAVLQEVFKLEDVLDGMWALLRHRCSDLSGPLIAESQHEALLQGMAELVRIGKEKLSADHLRPAKSKAALQAQVLHHKVFFQKLLADMLFIQTYCAKVSPSLVQNRETFWAEQVTQVKLLQQESCQRGTLLQSLLQKWEEFDANYACLEKDLEILLSTLPSVSLVEETEERLVERISLYQQIKRNLDGKHARLYQTLSEGKQLVGAVSCAELGGQMAKLEEQWLSLDKKIDQELHRLQTLLKHLLSYNRDSDELTRWLGSAQQTLNHWKERSLDVSQDLETVRSNISSFFEFAKEVDEKSSLKTAVLSTGNQLLHLKEADTATLRACLAQFEQKWTLLITQLPDIQEKLHQLQMEKLPSRKAITEMISWMDTVQRADEGAELCPSSTSQVRSLLQKHKECRMEMDYKQWIVDFVNQSLLQLSTCDVESKRYERTAFAEDLGEMNRQWHQVHGALTRKIQHLEQLLEGITESENKIQLLNSWLEAQEERLHALQRLEGVASLERLLLDCQDIENQLEMKSKALDELRQSSLTLESGTTPLLEDMVSKIDELLRRRDSVINQIHQLKNSMESVLQEWRTCGKLYEEANVMTIRFWYCLEHSQPAVLSPEALRCQVQNLQALQDEAESSEGSWEKLQEMVGKLKVVCPSMAEIMEEKYQATHARWTQVNQEVAEQLQKAQSMLQLWKTYRSAHSEATAKLEQQEVKFQQLANINMSASNQAETLPWALQNIKELRHNVQKTREEFFKISTPLDRLPQPAESSTHAFLSGQPHILQRAAYLEKMLLRRASDFEFVLSQFKDFEDQLGSLKALIEQEEENLNKLDSQKKEDTPDLLLKHVLALTAHSPDIERLNDLSLKLPLSEVDVKTLQKVNRHWIRATATALDRYSELQGIALNENFVYCCEKWVQLLEKVEEKLGASVGDSLPALLEQQKALEMLEAEVSVHQAVADTYITQALQLLDTEEVKRRPEFVSEFSELVDRWQRAAQGVRERKREVEGLLRQWQYFTASAEGLLRFLADTGHLLSALEGQDCYSLCQARSLIQELKNKEIHFQRWKTTYALTLEAGDKLKNISNLETKESVDRSLSRLQTSWEDAALRLGEAGKQLQGMVQTWEQCAKKMQELKSRLQVCKAQSSSPLPELHEDLQKEREHVKDLEKTLASWTQPWRELEAMKADVSRRALADDAMVLSEQMEHLHRQWDDLCLRVAMRKQEIEDRLNSWILFNEKNKELCAWLVQMENKVLQTADISIEEMIDKLQKDCMEEINLFSENKLRLKQMGDQLIKASNKTQAVEIDDKLNKINDRWQHLFDVIGSRVKKLKETLAFIQQLDRNMSNLRTWLARIESELSKPVVYDVCNDQEIQKRLAEQQDLQRDIEQHSAGVESVFNICDVLLHDSDACANETECDSIQQTTRSLDRRWRNICAMSMERRMKIEETWRLWQKFSDDYSRFEDWLQSAERTAACPNSSEVLYTNAKEELKRFEAFQRQIHERLTQLELINKQYRRLARENRTDTASKLKQMVHEGNQRWDNLQRRVTAVLRRLRHFTNQREEFEGTRESILVWLTEMDLQLTNVEHFSESDADDKIRQLNGFQQEITLNTNKIDQLIVFGEQLIQKSEPLDAVLIEDELEELHRYCQEVFGRVSRFHQRLTSHAPGLEDEKEASETETDLEDPREIPTNSWHKRGENEEPSPPQSLCHLVPLAPGHERSGCETPVSVDSIPLEWDHTGDVGGSSSHEEEEEGPFYSALSDVEIPENPEAYLKMTTKTLQASSGKSMSEGHAWHVPESPPCPKPRYEQMEGDTSGQPIPTDSSTPYKPTCVKPLLRPGADGGKEVATVLNGSPQQEDTGMSGAFDRWELIQTQELHSKLRRKQSLQQLNTNIRDITTWLANTEAEVASLKTAKPPSDLQEMGLRVQKLQEIIKAFDTYKALLGSAHTSSKDCLSGESAEVVELRSRLQQLSVRWEEAQGAVDSWRAGLRQSLMQCQDFHQLSHRLLLWLASAEHRRQRAHVADPEADPQVLLECQKELKQLEEELLDHQPQVNSLREIASSLLAKGSGDDYIEAEEKVHVIEKKLKQLLEQVAQDLMSLQGNPNPDAPLPASDEASQRPSAAAGPAPQVKVGVEGTARSRRQAESRTPGPAPDPTPDPSSSRPQRSFVSRVLRAALPLQLLLLLLLLLACLLPSSEEDYSCTQANNFARSFYPMLRYTNGPPPT